MKVSVIGLGYIGLPTATMLATHGAQVVGVDVSDHVIETINKGKIHIVEAGLEAMVQVAVEAGRLRAAKTPETSDAFLIAVPTPFKEDHVPDVSYVKSAANAIAPVLKRGDIVILESTSPVGTTEDLADWLREARPDLRFPEHGSSEVPDVHIAYCPERVLPGQVIRELVENDRIIGGITKACTEKAKEVYRVFVQAELHETNARTAEMSKLTENAFRDVNIAFANELSMISDRLGINVWELIDLANHHPRVNILKPGCGVGGHCIAVDPWFIVDKTPEEARLVREAREINDYKPQWVVEKVIGRLKEIERHEGKKDDLSVALLGLAFKPDIDDLRESPALHIAQDLEKAVEAKLMVVEPNITDVPNKLERSALVSLDQAIVKSDLVVVLVAHRLFVDARERLRKCENVIDMTGVLDG